MPPKRDTRIEITADGELVKVKVGTHKVDISYTSALRLSQLVRIHSKTAARNDQAYRSDALNIQKRSHEKLPEECRSVDRLDKSYMHFNQYITAATNHHQVVIKIKDLCFSLGWYDALIIAGWLKLKGREAKYNAGDTSKVMSVMGHLTASEPQGFR